MDRFRPDRHCRALDRGVGADLRLTYQNRSRAASACQAAPAAIGSKEMTQQSVRVRMLWALRRYFNQLFAECRNIVWLTARDEIPILRHFPVHPLRAGVFQVGVNRRP
jgi:hypothetical protein